MIKGPPFLALVFFSLIIAKDTAAESKCRRRTEAFDLVCAFELAFEGSTKTFRVGEFDIIPAG